MRKIEVSPSDAAEFAFDIIDEWRFDLDADFFSEDAAGVKIGPKHPGSHNIDTNANTNTGKDVVETSRAIARGSGGLGIRRLEL